jgi:hypothetical protein
MAGRPKTQYPPLFRPLYATLEDGTTFPLTSIPTLCPICDSPLVGPYGFQQGKEMEEEKFQCKNPECPFLQGHAVGHQFNIRTSARFQQALAAHLTNILAPLVKGTMTQQALAGQVHRSPALVTYLRHKVEAHLRQLDLLRQLVLAPALEDAVALDEFFLTIEGEPVYGILATGYRLRKVLGVKIAPSRDAGMMRAVFDEAERNNGKKFALLTIDAWGGSQKMAKELNRPIIVVIHKHKRPYDRAVIWKIEYVGETRVLHKVGVKTDFFKTRKKREYRYIREEEPCNPPAPKPRGRPKGVKNGQGTRKKREGPPRKRGPQGVFTVFAKGRKGYATVNPSKKKLTLAKNGPSAVAAALGQVIQVYGGMTIQNNLAETKNSVIEHRVWLSGPKDLESSETRLRTFLFFQNNPEQLEVLTISHRFRGDLLDHEIRTGIYGHILKANYLNGQAEKKVGTMN